VLNLVPSVLGSSALGSREFPGVDLKTWTLLDSNISEREEALVAVWLRKLAWSEFAEPIGRRHSAIHEEVAAGDKCSLRTHEECSDVSNLVRSTSSPSRRKFDHAPVARAARPFQLIVRQRSDDDAGTDRIDSRTALSPTDCLRHHPERVAALRNLVGVKGVFHPIGPEHRQGKQLINGRHRQQRVLLDRKWRQAMTGLGRDHDTGTPMGYDIAKLLQHKCGSVEIYLQDCLWRRLRWRNPGGMNDTVNLAKRCGGLDETLNRRARRNVNFRGAYVETGIDQGFGRRVGILLAQISKYNVFSCAYRRAIAWPIDPAPMTTITAFCVVFGIGLLDWGDPTRLGRRLLIPYHKNPDATGVQYFGVWRRLGCRRYPGGLNSRACFGPGRGWCPLPVRNLPGVMLS
jgi:hypothetical protein